MKNVRLQQIRLDNTELNFDRYLKSIMEERNCTVKEAIAFHDERRVQIQKIKEKGYTNEEAIKIWHKESPLSTKDTYKLNEGEKFNFQTRGVKLLFERLLGRGFKNEDTQIIRVILVENIANEEVITRFDGFTEIQLQFDQDKFFTLSDYEKKKETLELIMSGIKKVATYKGWDMRPFQEVYEKIIELDYENEEMKDKKIANHPTKKLRTRLLVKHDVQAIEIYVIVTDYRKKELYREKIITETLEDSTSYAAMISFNRWELVWKGDNKIVLSKNKIDLSGMATQDDELSKFIKEKENKEISEWVVRVPYNVIRDAKSL